MIFRRPSLTRFLAIPASQRVTTRSREALAPSGPNLSTRLRGNKPTRTTAQDAAAEGSSENVKIIQWFRETIDKKPRRRRKRGLPAAAGEIEKLRPNIGGHEEPKPSSGSSAKLEGKKSPISEPPKKRMPRPPPPHLRSPLSYSRRVEGLLDPDRKQCLQDLTPTSDHRPIAKLAHGLDRVLFNPGVHWLRDPRSRVYNFPPYLENIPKVTDFDFGRMTGFVKSSRDEDLWELAKREKRTFAGSTSSLTGMLSQIYFLISGDRDVDVSILSRSFAHEATNFTPGQRMPASVVMNYNDGVYAIDSDAEKSSDAEKNILTWMGTLLEKYLTMTPEEFTSYMRSHPAAPEAEREPMREAYRYAKSTKFVMRSQLDCHDSRLPGTGVFDIKTRACLPIRLDLLNFEENSGYLIRTQHGPMESFEKEYYDMIRSAFLKYSFQVRIGNMDGVIVAYHNTERMFGFQYIPLEEMDRRLFGSNPGAGDRVFEKCIDILELAATEIIRCFPKQSVRCTFETEERKGVMNIWVEPAVWESSKERPIKQLEVKVDSYLGEDAVRGSTAVTDVDSPWTLHWSISRLSGKDIDVREGLAASRHRQFRAYNVPTGVDIEDMATFWDNLNFSGKAVSEGEKLAYSPAFRKAGSNIELLRAVARAGREQTKQLMEAENGKPKIVLGQPEPTPSEVGSAAQVLPSSSETKGTARARVQTHLSMEERKEGIDRFLNSLVDVPPSQTDVDVDITVLPTSESAAVFSPSPTESSQSEMEAVSNPDANTDTLAALPTSAAAAFSPPSPTELPQSDIETVSHPDANTNALDTAERKEDMLP